MLEGKYFTVTESRTADGHGEFGVRLEKGHPVYEGHFPGNPVSPGVCNLQMVKECAEKVTGHRLTFRRVAQYRLMEVVSPWKEPALHVTVDIAEADGTYKLTAKVTAADVEAISVKGELTADDTGFQENN